MGKLDTLWDLLDPVDWAKMSPPCPVVNEACVVPTPRKYSVTLLPAFQLNVIVELVNVEPAVGEVIVAGDPVATTWVW